MADPKVEEVFRTSGVPTYTRVEPTNFNRLRVAVRGAGRGVVIEGPSGIGKSTAVVAALEAEGLGGSVQILSSRDPEDVSVIKLLPTIRGFGTIVIEDFHRLEATTQDAIADLLKLLADLGSQTSKVIIVGINRAGDSLIKAAPDLANRLDIIKLEAEQDLAKIAQVVDLGEAALNISMTARDDVIRESRGSYFLAQMLCLELCMSAGVMERPDEKLTISLPLKDATRAVLARQEVRFGETLRRFARGTRFRPNGRAAYLHVLRWLADSNTWAIAMEEEIAQHQAQKASVSQIVDKGYLDDLVRGDADISQLLSYTSRAQTLSVEDPHVVFYLRNVDWKDFTRRAGFVTPEHEFQYDFALSFAGEDRPFAELLMKALEGLDCTVFYDENEQARILAEDVEAFLAPIYASESAYVIVVLGPTYGERRWTRFESEQFKARFGQGRVIPIWSTKAPPTAFDTTANIGGRSFDPDGNLAEQATTLASLCEKKLRS